MKGDLTKGPVMAGMLRFAVPMILGNLLQQCYNVADTLIVGRYLGPDALAAVGSAYTLMTFITSILLGLCMGSGAVFSIRFGQRDTAALKEGMCASFALVALVTAALTVLSFAGVDAILRFLQVPAQIEGMMREYLLVIFAGIAGTFLYNYFASLLRAVGNSWWGSRAVWRARPRRRSSRSTSRALGLRCTRSCACRRCACRAGTCACVCPACGRSRAFRFSPACSSR